MRMLQRAAVLLACMGLALIAGCSTQQVVRTADRDAMAWPAPPEDLLAGHAPQLSPPVLTTRDALWQRVRSRMEMPGCHYHPQVDYWARRFSAHSGQFAASLRSAMPFMLLVLDELERRDLPGELLFLPYIESHYRPVASTGNRPAGMWQLMPGTARSHGLTIDEGYDGRLDAVASTGAALDLLERLERQFSDWRLVTMAFNAGEFRVKRALPGGDTPLSAHQLADLELRPTTHEHLFKLLGVACVIRDPARFAVRLPEPRMRDRLQAVELERDMALALAARLAEMAEADLRYLNAGYRGASASGRQLLLPLPQVSTFESAVAGVPPDLWNDGNAALGAQAPANRGLHPPVPEAVALLAWLDDPQAMRSGIPH